MDVVYYVAASMDGYIAREDGSVDWLEDLGISAEDSGFEEFFASVDGVVMGRKTWDQIRGFGDWPYGDKPAWVCTGSEPEAIADCALQDAREPVAVCEAARALGLQSLWLVGGGALAESFLGAGLLNRIVLSQMPVLLGRGIPLFGDNSARSGDWMQRMTLQSSRNFKGFVQMDYRLD